MKIVTFPQPQQDHDCEDFTVKAENGEMVCIRCGVVNELETAKEAVYNRSENDDKASSSDHNAGNKLYNSETPQQDYVSPANPGVAMKLNDPRGKDFQKKKIKPQLVNAYMAGNIAGKPWHIEQDSISGERRIVFSRYDIPTLQLFKQVTEGSATHFGLDTVQKTFVASTVTKLYSQIVMGPLAFYIASAALIESGVLNAEQKQEAVDSMVIALDELRLKLVTRCNKDLMKQAKQQILVRQQQQNKEQQLPGQQVEVPPATK
jgi:transcription initiation factor TFIIIB Brf1 subunit/transcription initiation factor TFIIB